MKTGARILSVTALGIVVVILIVGGYAYLGSERVIERQYDVPLTDLSIPTDSVSIHEGRRLAAIRGCFGCHGEALQGAVFVDDFAKGRAIAPNLTRVAHEYTTAELARAIRFGVRANGTGLQMMPSPMYYHLSDADLGRIIAFLRAAPKVAGPDYEFRAGPLTRWQMARGEWYPWTEDILKMSPRMEEGEWRDTLGYGKYLALTSCTECHGNDLTGTVGGPPNLAVVTAYSLDDFMTLMRAGRALGDRELPMMSPVARGRFSHFSDDEVRALHLFLRSKADGQRRNLE